MKTVRHPTRRYYTDGHKSHGDGVMFVTLPTIPGLTITADRSETDPTLPVIRTDRPRPHGIALQAAALQRAKWVREALQEARE